MKLPLHTFFQSAALALILTACNATKVTLPTGATLASSTSTSPAVAADQAKKASAAKTSTAGAAGSTGSQNAPSTSATKGSSSLQLEKNADGKSYDLYFVGQDAMNQYANFAVAEVDDPAGVANTKVKIGTNLVCKHSNCTSTPKVEDYSCSFNFDVKGNLSAQQNPGAADATVQAVTKDITGDYYSINSASSKNGKTLLAVDGGIAQSIYETLTKTGGVAEVCASAGAANAPLVLTGFDDTCAVHASLWTCWKNSHKNATLSSTYSCHFNVQYLTGTVTDK